MESTIVKTKKRFNIKYYEMNYKQELKETSLFLFLQDIATENAEIIGFGPSFIFPKNWGWFLLKYRIEFLKWPKALHYIEIETVSRGGSKIFAFRDFDIYSPSGEKIGRVASAWALIDMTKKSMLPVLKSLNNCVEFQKRDDDLLFNKIVAHEVYDYEKEFDVRFDDIDINKHANNVHYISWGFESLPYDFRENNNIVELDINYKKEISLGETVISKATIDDNTTRHVLIKKSTGEELCLIEAKWCSEN